ncbi:MAG: diacylglycerol kinase family protein [Bacteroidota bacterium]
MPLIQVIHNPGAGDGELSKEAIISPLEKAGYTCVYHSTKSLLTWKAFNLEKSDVILIAGGDGTVRKTCKVLLEKNYRERPVPIAVLPMGTANNLSKTLLPFPDITALLESIGSASVTSFGIGLTNLPDKNFFMESFGYGIFPFLMKEMKNRKISANTPKEEVTAALELLHELVLTYPPRHCELIVDEVPFSGDYIMAEIMNIKSIGPNLFISPNADPSDDRFEVVLVPTEKKQQFADYISRTLDGNKATFEFIEHSGQNITIIWEGTHVHIDDELLKLEENTAVNIRIEQSVFRFLVPAIKSYTA